MTAVTRLPDAVVAILAEAHAGHVTMGRYYHEVAAKPRAYDADRYRGRAIAEVAKATAIVQALRDNGCEAEADTLRANAAALEKALYAIPADLEDRMDLLDLAQPAERVECVL